MPAPTLGAGLQRFVGVFFTELAAYFRPASERSYPRHAARDHVAAVIAEHRPHVLITHSLGTVVAYEALFARPDLGVELFVTPGSPLGMGSVVYERLHPTQPPGRGLRPPNVGRWINIADPGDVVAIPRPFTKVFEPDENHEQFIDLLNFHSADRYLGSNAMRAAIAAWL